MSDRLREAEDDDSEWSGSESDGSGDDSEEEDSDEDEAVATKVASLVADDPCNAQCLRGREAALTAFVRSVDAMTKAQRKQSVLTALSVLMHAEAARPKRQRSRGEGRRFHYHLPLVGIVCRGAFHSCYGFSSPTIARYRKQIEQGSFSVRRQRGKQATNGERMDGGPHRPTEKNQVEHRTPLSPAMKDYALLCLVGKEEPWARAETVAAWAQLARTNPHLGMDAVAMRTRFYALVEQFDPDTDAALDITDEQQRRKQVKLREICYKLEAFHTRNDHKKRSTGTHHGHGHSGRSAQEACTSVNTAKRRRHTTAYLPMPDSESSEQGDSPRPSKNHNQQQQGFAEAQMQLLRMHMSVEKSQAQLYAAILERQQRLPARQDLVDRQLQLLEDQVALQRDQARVHERQLAMIESLTAETLR